MNITVCEYPNGYAGDFFCALVSLCCKDYYKISQLSWVLCKYKISELCWNPGGNLEIYYPINTKEDYINEYEYLYLPDKIYKDIDFSTQQNLIISSHGLGINLQYDEWYNIDNRVNKVINLQLFSENKIINHCLFPIWNVSQRDLKSVEPAAICNHICQNIRNINILLKKRDIYTKNIFKDKTTFANIIPSLVDNDFDRFKNVFIKLFNQVDLVKLKELFDEYQIIKMKPYYDFLNYVEANDITLPIYTPNENYSHVIS